MSSKKQALQDLLETVDAGGANGNDFADVFGSPCQDMEYDQRVHSAKMAYRGSLDAAKALHDTVLHERVVCELKYSVRYGGLVRLWDMGALIGEAENANPARAWLIAALKALISEQDT